MVCARDLRPGSCVSAVCVIYILKMLHLRVHAYRLATAFNSRYLYIVNSRHYPLVNCGAGDRAHNASVRAPGARGAGRLVPLPP